MIAKAIKKDTAVSVSVYPTAIKKDHPLSTVRNEFNAIFSTGNMVGESMIYGKGAGSLPTGSAVMSDILDIAFDINHHRSRRNLEEKIEPVKVESLDQQRSKFFMRVFLKDQAGVLEEFSHLFKVQNINISRLIQKETENNQAEVVVITDDTLESNFNELKNDLEKSSCVLKLESIIRVGL